MPLPLPYCSCNWLLTATTVVIAAATATIPEVPLSELPEWNRAHLQDVPPHYGTMNELYIELGRPCNGGKNTTRIPSPVILEDGSFVISVHALTKVGLNV